MLGIILGSPSLVGMAAIIKGMKTVMKENHDRQWVERIKFCSKKEDVPADQEYLAESKRPAHHVRREALLEESAR